MLKKQNGITLIALIITIIVMLVLVGVTINVALNGGLFDKADEAARATEEKAILEEMLAMMEMTDKGKFKYNTIIEKMKQKYMVEYSFPNATITGKLGTYNYIVSDTEIKIGSLNQEDLELLQRYFLGEIDETTGKRQGIDVRTLVANPEILENLIDPTAIRLKNNNVIKEAYTDIEITNFKEFSTGELEICIKYHNNIYILKIGSDYVCNAVEYLYKEEFRTLLKEVVNNPESYLKQAQALGQSEELTDIGIGTDGKVVNLSSWVYSIGSNGVVLGSGGSYSLGYKGEYNSDGTIIGTVPQYIYSEGIIFTVIEMQWIFSRSTELKIAPRLPDTVEELNYVFIECTSLETACDIPSTVTDARGVFRGCTSLTGTITVNSDVLRSGYDFLYQVGSAERPIVLKGTGNNLEILEEIKATGNSEYITIEQ